MSDSASIKEKLTREAHKLGFADVRVAKIDGPAAHSDAYEAWIAAGHHGDMAWLARNMDRRKDPRLVLPEARSLLVLATNYYQPLPNMPAESPEPAGSRGEISRYAWGVDYHDVIEARLDQLAAVVESFGGKQRRYVDTGPVLERSWATTAGMGWNGKSTLQIHPKLGAWFFLSEIITTLDLPADPPTKLSCGTCTRCITACPTGAIDRPHHLAAEKCLSYLSIEHKGAIPVEYRKAFGARIYGCDDCIVACPWNRFAQASGELAFSAREYVHGWPLRDFLALDDAAFRTIFKGSPIKRVKRPAFLRNVCVALGNVGTAEDLPALRLAALDESPLIAEHAVWAIEEILKNTPPDV